MMLKAKNFKTSLLLINKGEGCVPLDRSTNRRKVIIKIDVRKKNTYRNVCVSEPRNYF
jgi:hypothetical protein